VILNDLTNSIGEWLRGSGPQADIVMSTRIRLARNLAEFPFISRASDQDQADIERILRDRQPRVVKLFTATSIIDSAIPAPLNGFWYLSRAESTCGIGSFGTRSNGSPRTTTTCP
jgi:hypothetical protein